MRLVMLFDNFGPYHLARLAATRARGGEEGITVYGLETVDRSEQYQWDTGNKDERKHIFTIFSGYNALPPCTPGVFFQIWRALNRLRPDALALPGYKDLVAITAFIWAKTHGKITVMMTDSTYEDKVRSLWVEYLKRQIVSRFDAALVAGRRQKEYAAFLRIPEERIFLGYDVVDNDYFAREAEKVRRRKLYYRNLLRLPHRYFLTVCRFIPVKNLSGLIRAYAGYRQLAGGTAWDLVICGSGPLEESLKSQASNIPGIHFPGFIQADKLPWYYGLASTFIIPSSSETWGLVVNEAMASGLPVLVSRICGCAPDLVQEGINGFSFDPVDFLALSRLLLKMASGELDLKVMGEASRKIIAKWTPETFAENLILAFKSRGS